MPGGWTFLTNHGHVLVGVASDPDARLREIAARVGITERAAQLIVSDLEASGYLDQGARRPAQPVRVDHGRRFRHPAEADARVDSLIAIFVRRRLGAQKRR